MTATRINDAEEPAIDAELEAKVKFSSEAAEIRQNGSTMETAIPTSVQAASAEFGDSKA